MLSAGLVIGGTGNDATLRLVTGSCTIGQSSELVAAGLLGTWLDGCWGSTLGRTGEVAGEDNMVRVLSFPLKK